MQTLADRTVSGFPLSIGTGLAFESIFAPIIAPYDPNRVIPNTISILNYNELWINVYTLFRNLTGSIEKELFIRTKPEEFAEVLNAEMEFIQSLLQTEGNDVCKPIFYRCSYEEVYTKQPKQVMLRKDNTATQVLHTTKYVETMNSFNKLYPDCILKLDSKLKPSRSIKGLIITHVAYDLLSHKYFKELNLLESHTGVLKPINTWYTKYYPVPHTNMNILPFLRMLLKIFGDHTFFAPLDIRLRRTIMEIAVNCHWTVTTTKDKVLQDLELFLKEKYLYEMIKQF